MQTALHSTAEEPQRSPHPPGRIHKGFGVNPVPRDDSDDVLRIAHPTSIILIFRKFKLQFASRSPLGSLPYYEYHPRPCELPTFNSRRLWSPRSLSDRPNLRKLPWSLDSSQSRWNSGELP